MRTEFGYSRTTCACENCKTNCRFMPGFLIPADLERLLPMGTTVNGGEWAEQNLLASPGALAIKNGQMIRIRTLVPATKLDGSCIHLSEQGLCQIHENAPFGCAFFDCGPDGRWELSDKAMRSVIKAWTFPSLYMFIWLHLWATGRRQHSPDVLRRRMKEYMDGKKTPVYLH